MQTSEAAHIDQNIAGLQVSPVFGVLGGVRNRQGEQAGPRLMTQGMESQTGDADRESKNEQQHYSSPAVGSS